MNQQDYEKMRAQIWCDLYIHAILSNEQTTAAKDAAVLCVEAYKKNKFNKVANLIGEYIKIALKSGGKDNV